MLSVDTAQKTATLSTLLTTYNRKEMNMEEKKLPVYESPKVVTYTDEELLEELGPAQTGYVKGDSAFWARIKNILTFPRFYEDKFSKKCSADPFPDRSRGQVWSANACPVLDTGAGDKPPALQFLTRSG